MDSTFPYTLYSCPCSNSSSLAARQQRRTSLGVNQIEYEDEEQTFNPHSPIANYSLYPLEHLLYCEECREIRCWNCSFEEVSTWFCPSCLFEFGSSMVKTEGNRCSRNCFDCPVCSSPLSVNGLDQAPSQLQPEVVKQAETGPRGPFFLACSYCAWSSLDIGIQFEKPTGISEQLAKIKNGGEHVSSLREIEREREKKKAFQRGEDRDPATPDRYTKDNNPNSPLDHELRFSSLAAFYKSQVTQENPMTALFSPDYGYNSPSALTRIMSMYSTSGIGVYSARKPQQKPQPMREAYGDEEGIRVYEPGSDTAIIDRMRDLGWAGQSSIVQRSDQLHPAEARFEDDLRPQPTLLRSKRTKRCRTCRHILVKPDGKVTSTRYKIRLLALNYIPRMTLKGLPTTSTASSSVQPNSTIDFQALVPGKPVSMLLRMTNPRFDRIRVTLATPSTTPGRVENKVTILCPQFEVGANTDVWDEALKSGESKGPARPTRSALGAGADAEDKENMLEAGKVWESGKNWASVVLEVIPGQFPSAGKKTVEEDGLEEDEDILEIPVWVRIEYETDVQVEDEGKDGPEREAKGNNGGERREKRELAYWSVLGVGRIAGTALGSK